MISITEATNIFQTVVNKVAWLMTTRFKIIFITIQSNKNKKGTIKCFRKDGKQKTETQKNNFFLFIFTHPFPRHATMAKDF